MSDVALVTKTLQYIHIYMYYKKNTIHFVNNTAENVYQQR